MNDLQINIEAVKKCIADSLAIISENKNEQVLRDSFTSYLRQIYPTQPSWVIRHIQGSEAAVKIDKGKGLSTGFVDNLVDLTAIEYESDLSKAPKFNEGFNQVKDYCSSLVNQGHEPELIIGILSDTIHWYAYQINIDNLPTEQATRANLELIEIESIVCRTADDISAHDLVNFLNKYLGRIGSRPVSAYSIAKDLGFESPFCTEHIEVISNTITKAFKDNQKYSSLVANLWCNFVSYLREDSTPEYFDIKNYIDEYYILTLGKLICANYIEKKALSSDHRELKEILSGIFFENKGLINFVEYDYFGWLNSEPYLSELIIVAEAIQQDLVAYNFNSEPTEDLFGQLMAQLANRSQRLLLGQEWTPTWLSRKIVSEVASKIPQETPLQLIDMCCGSGSMIVETLDIAKKRIISNNDGISDEERNKLLVQAITGFDIDPLAVILSKINWILASMDWLQPLGTYNISIPIYHADSLFAITPISNHFEENEEPTYILRIADFNVELPDFLITPEYQSFFDNLIDTGYHLAVENIKNSSIGVGEKIVNQNLQSIKTHSNIELDEEQEKSVLSFLNEFTEKVDILNKDGRNGIWAYILRNSFRPGLVAGQFNGLVSNPPWLALSKIADNPYQHILKRMAADFDIKPPGSSHLHIELATIFLLHSVQKYLIDEAPIGCVNPETILNGHHHNPFRKGQYYSGNSPVDFAIDTIWKIPKNVFKNNGIVLFGTKSEINKNASDTINGYAVSEIGEQKEIVFYKNVQGNRTSWSESKISESSSGFFTPANFRQGADIMPRNLLFYETQPSTNANHYSVYSINPVTSNFAFTVKDAKKYTEFTLSSRLLPKTLFFDIVTSNLLTPFHLAEVQKALLPIKKNENNIWEVIQAHEINSLGTVTRNTIREIARTLDPSNGDIETIFQLIDTRGKLSQQIINEGGYIVFTGAGGGKVCSAYISVSDYNLDKLILDQTVYWAQVETEEEAIYLSGLLNSNAINSIIEDFQPRGAFGKRHVHKLPFGVTPPFDSSQVSHQDVVDKTRNLINDYMALISSEDSNISELLNPNTSTLSRRRKKIMEAISALESYEEYELACQALYGI